MSGASAGAGAVVAATAAAAKAASMKQPVGLSSGRQVKVC